MFLLGYDGRMHCLDLESGSLRWSSSVSLPTDANTEIKSAPLVDSEAGIALTGTHGGTVAAFSACAGHLLWRLRLPGAIFATPLLMPARGEMSLGPRFVVFVSSV